MHMQHCGSRWLIITEDDFRRAIETTLNVRVHCVQTTRKEKEGAIRKSQGERERRRGEKESEKRARGKTGRTKE